jgi:hypothetical protein
MNNFVLFSKIIKIYLFILLSIYNYSLNILKFLVLKSITNFKLQEAIIGFFSYIFYRRQLSRVET